MSIIYNLHNFLKEDLRLFDVYEFGVCDGNSLREICEVFNYKKFQPRNIFGFDSFIGLPEEQNDPLNQYVKGDFNASERLKANSVEETKSIVYNKIMEKCNASHLYLIDGFFSETLCDELVEKYSMGPAYLANIDCDTYSSSIECLDFMFRNNLVKPNTLLRFDDWGSLGYQNCESGESRAFLEITEKYKVKYEIVDSINWGNPPPDCVIMTFRVKSIG